MRAPHAARRAPWGPRVWRCGMASLALCVACAAATAAWAAPAAVPRNLIVMIPDGCGPSTVALARMLRGRALTLDSLLTGTVGTASQSSRVTDSAAAATTYATGLRTRNRMLSMDSSAVPRRTLFEAAAARGMATGLVVKSRVTDATPAAFIAHATERSREEEIAEQELAHRPDVLLGGGADRFLPAAAGGTRRDGRDLIEESRRAGVQVLRSRDELRGPLRTPLLGLFAARDLGLAIDDAPGTPALAFMTLRAIGLLRARPRGFVLVVEGSLIDHAAHGNDPAGAAREALEFDDAVREAVAFARRDGHTLIVCMADHETGGLALRRGDGDHGSYGVEPESLFAVRASARRMADSIEAGATAAPLFERLTGLHLTTAEADSLRAAAAGRRHLAETIGELESRHAKLGWSTWGHTAADVGLGAFGPGAERFRGRFENDEVGRRMAASLGLAIGAPLPQAASAR
jgi:alkaline phosphatase